MFISIGNVCVVAHWLRKTQSTETFFFDWLVTSLRSVNEVLSIENEETMRTKLKNVTFEGTLDNNKVVVCKDFDRLKSVHDLPIMNGNIDTHFVDKYVRRHARLIDTIKSNPNLHFVLFVEASTTIGREFNNDIETFHALLNKLNAENRFKMTILSTKQIETISDFWCNIVCLEDFRTSPVHSGWTLSHYDWDTILKKLSN